MKSAVSKQTQIHSRVLHPPQGLTWLSLSSLPMDDWTSYKCTVHEPATLNKKIWTQTAQRRRLYLCVWVFKLQVQILQISQKFSASFRTEVDGGWNKRYKILLEEVHPGRNINTEVIARGIHEWSEGTPLHYKLKKKILWFIEQGGWSDSVCVGGGGMWAEGV